MAVEREARPSPHISAQVRVDWIDLEFSPFVLVLCHVMPVWGRGFVPHRSDSFRSCTVSPLQCLRRKSNPELSSAAHLDQKNLSK